MISERQIAESISNKIQELILLPTEKCNFRCTYCYEDFEIGKMPEDVVKGIKNLIRLRAGEISKLKLGWFGGEPLLASNIILDISEYAYNLSRKHGFELVGGLTTNAYVLTQNLFKKLIGYNQSFFQISLDGYGSEHDVTRKRADGKGTFDVIWNNLLSYKEVDGYFDILLRLHLTGKNFSSMKRLAREIALAFGDDARFRVNLGYFLSHQAQIGYLNNLVIQNAELDFQFVLYEPCLYHRGYLQFQKSSWIIFPA